MRGRVPQSAADIVPIMFKRKLDTHQMTFALGKALAHLHLLWLDGRVEAHAGRGWRDPVLAGVSANASTLAYR